VLGCRAQESLWLTAIDRTFDAETVEPIVASIGGRAIAGQSSAAPSFAMRALEGARTVFFATAFDRCAFDASPFETGVFDDGTFEAGVFLAGAFFFGAGLVGGAFSGALADAAFVANLVLTLVVTLLVTLLVTFASAARFVGTTGAEAARAGNAGDFRTGACGGDTSAPRFHSTRVALPQSNSMS